MTMTVLNPSNSAQSAKCDAAGNLLVAVGSGGGSGSVATGVAPANRSGTITTGGVSQLLAAPKADRKGFYIRNNSASSLYIEDINGAAVTTGNSLEIKSGEYYEFPYVTLTALYIIGPVTGQSFTAREW